MTEMAILDSISGNVIGTARKGAVVKYAGRLPPTRTCRAGFISLVPVGIACAEGLALDPDGHDRPAGPSSAGPLKYHAARMDAVPLFARPSARTGSIKPPAALGIAKLDRTLLNLTDFVGDGESVAQWAMAGFIIAADREETIGGQRWLHLPDGSYADATSFSPLETSRLQGVEIGNDNVGNSVAFVLRSAHPYARNDPDAFIPQTPALPRYSHLFLTGRSIKKSGTTFLETTSDGIWVRKADVTRTQLASSPAGLGGEQRWIDVNLGSQTLVLYEGDRPVFATLVSSGKASKQRDQDHSTPEGTFRIWFKAVSTVMDQDGRTGVAAPYRVQEVPYAMFFHESYALHGATWHDGFGEPRSHGCVNLSPSDALRVFLFSKPEMPAGWHSARTAVLLEQQTIVRVHGGRRTR